MNPTPDLNAHVEFQLSLLRLTAATAIAEKAPKAEAWSENAQSLQQLAEQGLKQQEMQPVRVNKL